MVDSVEWSKGGNYIWYIPKATNTKITVVTLILDNYDYHRYDGPACLIFDEEEQWWIRGKNVDEVEYKKWLDESDMDMYNLSNEDKLLIDLKWG